MIPISGTCSSKHCAYSGIYTTCAHSSLKPGQNIGKIDLMNAAVVTDSAAKLARDLVQDVGPLLIPM